MGIKAKILAPSLVIVLAVASAITLSNIAMFSVFVDASTVDRIDASARVVDGSLALLKAEAGAVSLSMARHPGILAAVETGDRAAIQTHARALQDESGVEFCTITDPKGVVLARTHEPGICGDSLSGQADIQSAMYGQPLTVIAEGSLVRLSVRSAAPVINARGEVLGVVSAGFRLDTDTFVDRIKSMMGCETTIVLGDERIATTVQNESGVRITGTKADEHITETVLAGNSYSGRVDIEGEMAVCKYTPIYGPDGRPVGMVFVGQYLSEETRTIAAFVRGGSVILLLTLAVSVAVILPVVRRVDATLKTQAEKIRSEHERVKLLLDATPMVSRLWDRDLRLIECNEAAVSLFGLRDKSEYIERYFDLSPEYQSDGRPSREKSRELVQEAFEKGECVYEWTYQLPDGTPVPAEATMVRVPYGDDYVVAGYSRDLREHKKMMAEIKKSGEELEAALAEAKLANSAKSSFLAQMSHEIRTPLNAVVGLSELALDSEGLDDELAGQLEKILSSGMTILSIVNNILDISKIESGKFELLPVKYDAPSLINDIVTLNIVHIGEKPVNFRLRLGEDFPGLLCGDDLRVKQIFNNLLSNAMKYTHAGSVDWQLDFEREGDSVWIVSTVSDTGVGIRQEDLKRLFSEYNQADAAANRRVEGTGLGLAITRRLVDMMDGKITVESEYGKGSAFHVRLRQAFVSDTPIGKTVAQNLMGLRYRLERRGKHAALARVDLSYAHVLVVDDIATNLDVVKGILKPYKMKIDCALSGAKAIEMIKAESPRYSAIFMDHMMPEMDGIEATRIIREELGTPYAKNIPVIALTANAIVGNEELFLSRGFQAFLTKPIDISKLDAVLRRWVRDKDRESSARTDAPAAERSAEYTTVFPEDMTISGIDHKKALERFGNDEAVLIDVLRSYSIGTRPILSDLRAFLEAGDLSAYAIAVHGVKGSSYGILARELGGLAGELEKAAKDGDADSVKAGHGEFESAALALLDELDRALELVGAGRPLSARPDPATLKELRDACAAFEMDRVDAAMEKLEACRYGGDAELIAWLREKVDDMAFEDIAGMELPPQDSASPGWVGFTAPGARLLLVDDSEADRAVTLGRLMPLRVRVDTAENGADALERLMREAYHLVLMDDLMPVMDGVETTKRLRDNESGCRNIPVIALTADEAAGERERFLSAGADDFLTKPVSGEKLFAALRRWLPAGLLLDEEKRSPGAQTPGERAELPIIEGIDSRKGVLLTGNKELYLGLLRDMYLLIDLKADKIERCLKDGTLRDAAIEAHAIKNAVHMMGAEELAAVFGRMEYYCKSENRDALTLEAPKALEKLRSLKPLLKPFGEMKGQNETELGKKELIALLVELETAVAGLDVDLADEVMRRLRECRLPAQCAAQMKLLRAHMADVAIDEVSRLAAEMRETVEKLPNIE